MDTNTITLPEGFVLDEPELPEGFVLDEPAIPDPREEEKQIKETVDISYDLGVPVFEVDTNYKQLADKPEKRPPSKAPMSLVAYTPSRWEKFKDFFVSKREPLPPNADRIEKITRAFDIGMSAPLRAFMKFSKGMTLGAPDLMWAAIKRITPDDMWVDEVKNMTLDEAMDWAGGYDPSGFQKSVGEIAEFVGRLRTVAPIAQKIGIIGNTPKDITVLDKAFESAKLFGAAAVGEQVAKYASTKIDPTEAEYGYEGPKAVLRDMAIGAIFSLVHSGVKGAWSKLTPTEHQRALKLLGLKEGASTNEIKSAARDLFRKYHPDKAKGFQAEFERVVKARDTLIKGEPQDIVFRGQKIVFKPKLLPGETVEQQAIRLAKKPTEVVKAAPTKPIPAPTKPVEPIKVPEPTVEGEVVAQTPEDAQRALRIWQEYLRTGDDAILEDMPPGAEIPISPEDVSLSLAESLDTSEKRVEFKKNMADAINLVERGGAEFRDLTAEVIAYQKVWGKTDPLPTDMLRYIGMAPSELTPTPPAEPIKEAAPTVEAKQAPAEAKGKVRDILGGVEPITQINKALKDAVEIRPKVEAERKAELRKRVGAAAGTLKSTLKKGEMGAEEAIGRSTGLLKGPLSNARYESIRGVMEEASPGAVDNAFRSIGESKKLKYFEVVGTKEAFAKLIDGIPITLREVEMIKKHFGIEMGKIAKERAEKSSLSDRAFALWRAGLLTGIKTSGLNTLSNLTHALTETAKDVIATPVDIVASLFTGERTVGFTVRGIPGGMKKGWSKGWEYLKTGIDERGLEKKLDYEPVNFGESKTGKLKQVYVETIFHIMGAEDQPFFYGAMSRSIRSQAIAQGRNKGLKGQELRDFVEQARKTPTQDMLENGIHDAEIAVFQNRTILGDIARAIQKAPIARWTVPFSRTPSAVAMQIINYTPVGPIKEVMAQIHKGEFNQRDFVHAVGRAGVGIPALAIGALLFTKGLMTLDYPKGERERKLWELEGKKPFAVKIGDKWRSVYVLGPIGNVLLIGGFFQKALTESGSPSEAIVTALSGGAKSFSEQTFVIGMSRAVDAMKDPERSFDRFFSSMAGSFVPTILSDIASATDYTERTYKGPWQAAVKRVPVARRTLEERIDVFGQDLPRYGGNPLEVMIDATRPAKIRQDVVVDEIRRLWDKDVKVAPTQLGNRDGYKILTQEENTILWRQAGRLAYQNLFKLIQKRSYLRKDDKGKGKMIEEIIKEAKDLARAEAAQVKLNQGKTLKELKEDGLVTVDVEKEMK